MTFFCTGYWTRPFRLSSRPFHKMMIEGAKNMLPDLRTTNYQGPG